MRDFRLGENDDVCVCLYIHRHRHGKRDRLKYHPCGIIILSTHAFSVKMRVFLVYMNLYRTVIRIE